jgi:hypothetical protein
MKLIAIYNFSELSENAKANAIENVRSMMRDTDYHEACRWAIDDCALFEPAHKEMAELFGEDYYEKNGNDFVFKNNRTNIEYDDYEIHIQQALEITNPTMFRKWLGIPDSLAQWVEYEIIEGPSRTGIEFEITLLNNDPRYPALQSILENADAKFEAHVLDIMKRIESGIDEYFSDENVEDRIEENDYEFLEGGTIYE